MRLPDSDKGLLRAQEDGPGMFAVTGEIAGIGVLGSLRLSTLPVYGSIEPDQPELGLARIGFVGVHTDLPIAGTIRVDASEAARIDAADLEDQPAAAVDRFIDEAALWWRPKVWASFIAGRQKVPFTRYRQLDVTLLSAGAVPFAFDRITPDRRWGALLHGDLGALSYAGGIFADSDRLEMRQPDDPSQDGRVALSFHTEWTPRAPIGRDQIATPTSDPWFDTVRPSVGLGVLYRGRGGDRGGRLDLSASGLLKYRHYSAMAEAIVSSDAELTYAAAAELGVLPIDTISLFTRGDYDGAIDRWSVGWGMSFFATDDRRSRISIYGWLRRDTDSDRIRRDGVIVQIQAAL